MTVKEFKKLISTLKLEVELFLRERYYNPFKWDLEDFCRKIAEYYRPSKTRPVFTSLMAKYAMKYGKERIVNEMGY